MSLKSGFLLSLAVAGFVFLSGCAAGPDFSKLPPLPTHSAPEAPAAKSLAAYKIQIGDTLDVRFYLNPELNETVVVRPDGMISTALASNIRVYNLTVSDLNARLEKVYEKELQDPRITTAVKSFAPIRIYVSGEVNAPGEYVVVGQALTLTQAIARAGGIKNSGEETKVLVIRRGASETPQVYVADYYGATQGGDPSKDARLAPYDVVFVPKTGVALTYKGYQQNIQQFINPSTGLSASHAIR